MKKKKFLHVLLLPALIILASCSNTSTSSVTSILFKDATLLDGNGGAPVEHTDILIKNDTIAAIGTNLDSTGAQVINASGKTIMPALISTHVHVGTLQGTKTSPDNYTVKNIQSQLKKYQDYGVLNVLSMGTDRPPLFGGGFYDSLKAGRLNGARMYSAGYGFGVPQGGPGMGPVMDQLYRPENAAQAIAQVDTLAKLLPAVIKIWVDDFAGRYKKMAPEIYKAIISEAHKHHLRVVAHVYYLADARNLVANGIDVIGHSIRDSVVDDVLVQQMKAKGVVYIPTLSLDEFAFVYARKPEWIDDAFFKASLEPGVFEMISSTKYQEDVRNSPTYHRDSAGFENALKNLKKLYNAGVLVSLGTDSGATPVRIQGFSEHLELELMVQAGLTPLQAIGVATKNASMMLRINNRVGTLEKGKLADLIILSDNPATNIKNTRKIEAVYRDGKQVSKGPL